MTNRSFWSVIGLIVFIFGAAGLLTVFVLGCSSSLDPYETDTGIPELPGYRPTASSSGELPTETDSSSGTASSSGELPTETDSSSGTASSSGELPTETGDAGPPIYQVLRGTIRDFSSSHPDFERPYDLLEIDLGIVQGELDDDRKPVYASDTGTATTAGRDSFEQWFKDVEGVNSSADYLIVLDQSATEWTYNDSEFFPIDNQLFGNETNEHNYHFTIEIHSRFRYSPGQYVRFYGDDDFWLFVNRELVIDLGGIHAEEIGEADLDELSLSAGELATIDIFFAERHTYESNFNLETNIGTFEQ